MQNLSQLSRPFVRSVQPDLRVIKFYRTLTIFTICPQTLATCHLPLATAALLISQSRCPLRVRPRVRLSFRPCHFISVAIVIVVPLFLPAVIIQMLH